MCACVRAGRRGGGEAVSGSRSWSVTYSAQTPLRWATLTWGGGKQGEEEGKMIENDMVGEENTEEEDKMVRKRGGDEGGYGNRWEGG